MKENVLQRLYANEQVSDADKKAFEKLYKASQKIQFGKIGPRLNGYIMDQYKLPRCTSVLQMDGTKAGALMEWAKRQVSERVYKELEGKLMKGRPIGIDDVFDACALGLADPDEQKNKAAETGTEKHDLFEDLITSDKQIDSKACEEVRRFNSAWKLSGHICIATEIPVAWVDEKGHGFGGRLDILAYKDGKFYIDDNKTSRSVHESYGCQVAAYAKAVEQMTEGAIKIAGGCIFHIPNLETLNARQKKEYDKRGSLIMLKDLEEAFEHYRLLLELYYKRNNKYF